MDVEKTIEFILSQQARTEAVLGRLAERQEQTDAQLRQTNAQLRETDALLRRAIRAAVQEARAERRRRAELREELSAAQRKTEATLAAFIESLRRGGNGHSNH